MEHFLGLAEKEEQIKNIWLLKPSDLNRGRGIQLFSSLRLLYYILIEYSKEQVLRDCLRQLNRSQYLERIDEKIESQIRSSMLKARGQTRDQSNPAVKKPERQIVLQKYIETPLLISERKFDIRMWVLIDQDLNYYYFREPYIRLSSEKFSLHRKDLHNKFIHLTNNAVQKTGVNYCRYEEGNIWSIKQLELYLRNVSIDFDVEHIMT